MLVEDVGLYNEDMLRKNAPAIFASEPASFVSDKYSFVPTYKVIRALEKEGFRSVSAQQRSWRSPEERPVGKHVVRLRHQEYVDKEDFGVGDSIPELVIFNAHNWQERIKLKFGVFRLICSNGLVIPIMEFGDVSRIHRGFDEDEIIGVSREFVGSISEVDAMVRKFQQTRLTPENQTLFAADAAKLRWDTPPKNASRELLNVRRDADNDNSMWVVMNRVQENALRGGFHNVETGRVVRRITNIDRERDINEGIWALAEQYVLAAT